MLLAALLAFVAPEPVPECTFANAVTAQVREMARNPDARINRCVQIAGFANGSYFYTDAPGFRASREGNRRDDDGWLGLYFERESDYVPRLRRGVATGVLRDCAREFEAARAQADSGEIVWATGYCHTREGLILLRARFRAQGPARFDHRD